MQLDVIGSNLPKGLKEVNIGTFIYFYRQYLKQSNKFYNNNLNKNIDSSRVFTHHRRSTSFFEIWILNLSVGMAECVYVCTSVYALINLHVCRKYH